MSSRYSTALATAMQMSRKHLSAGELTHAQDGCMALVRITVTPQQNDMRMEKWLEQLLGAGQGTPL